MIANLHPKIVIVQENENFCETFCNIFLPYSDALIMKCSFDIIQINHLIQSIEPDFIVVELDTKNNLKINNFNEVKTCSQKECKILFLSSLFGLKEKLEPFTIEIPSKNSHSKQTIAKQNQINKDWVGLQTNIGIRFVNKSDIVIFRYSNKTNSQKERWEVLLQSSETFQLKINSTSKDILKYFSDEEFIQISQKCIVNIKYLKSVETKSRKCTLHEPFENNDYVISRSYFNDIKERFGI